MAGTYNYFPSGSNQPGHIAALRGLGLHVGVAANEINEAAELELLAMAGTGLLVFVDSGAFGEVKFPKGGGAPKLKKAITDAEWDKRLGLYERLAAALGPQLYVVAPDRVGCQRTTLERLDRYAGRVRGIAAMGAHVIVPLQRGELTAAEFDAVTTGILGLEDHVRGIPLKNAATTWEEWAALAAELPAGTRVHLLGKAPGAKKVAGKGWDDYLEVAAHLDVTCDAVLVRRLVGRDNGPGNGPRILTIEQDRVRAELKLPAAPARLGTADAYRVAFAALTAAVRGLPPVMAEGQPGQLELLAA